MSIRDMINSFRQYEEFQKIMQSIDLKWQKKERIRNKRINTIKILMQKLNE